MPYEGIKLQAYLAVFNQLLAAGWDLPANHAQALIDMPDERHRSLEQQYLVARYLCTVKTLDN